jgi:O-antigen ligase
VTLEQERAATPVGTEPERLDSRGSPRLDGVTFLTAYLLLLFLLPSKLVLGPLGAAGAPAGLVAVTGALWWLLMRLAGRTTPEVIAGGHPVRAAVGLFATSVMVSYIVFATRSATATESHAADAALILLTGWLGIVLIGGDAIPDRARLDTLVRRLVVAVGLEAVLGILQFGTGRTLVDLIQVPGLSVNNGGAAIQARDGFTRVIGTAIHPIEFGVVTAALLPLCVHLGVHGSGGRWRRWWPTLAVAVAVPLSISRSAVVAVGIAILCAAPSWSRGLRRRAMAFGVLLGCATFVLVPGMLGTLAKLFLGVSGDSSALSRTNSYALAAQFIDRSPWLGRGFMTFLPEYHTNDNQYLGLLIEVGVVGVAMMLLVFVTGIAVARGCRRRSSAPETRSLGAALAASLASIMVTFAFFDALSFPLLTGVTFLLLGITESLRRLERQAPNPAP